MVARSVAHDALFSGVAHARILVALVELLRAVAVARRLGLFPAVGVHTACAGIVIAEILVLLARAVAFGAVLSHIAFDVFLADVLLNSATKFPLFSPFTFETVSLQGLDWLGIQIIGVSIVAITSYFFKRKEIKVKNSLTKT